MEWVLVIGLLVIGGYFAMRYFSMKKAVQDTVAQLEVIREDITQNRRVHLSIPDGEFENLSIALNVLIKKMQEERIESLRRERAFQGQIEAISHDLRTPLTVIIGYLSILTKENEERALTEAELKEMLDIIQRKAGGMEKLVEQFYEYSRLISKDTSLNSEAVDINKVTRETFINNVILLEQASVEATLALGDMPLWVLADEAALERVITNLLQNVSRYALSELDITLKEEKDVVKLYITNDTEGIEDDAVDKLFDRFFTNDSARPEGSTGLGLTIAKGLVEEMGGEIEAKLLIDNKKKWLQIAISLKKI